MNARQLAERIAGEIPPKGDGDCLLRVDRSWKRGPVAGMRPRTCEELMRLHDGLCRAVPDDFDFCLEFGADGGVFAFLEFDDGAQTCFGMSFTVSLDRNLFASLRALDWDDLRGEAIQATQFQENVCDSAADYPSKLEPCEAVQARHKSRLAAFEKAIKASGPSFAVLVCDEDSGPAGYEETRPKDLKNLFGDLGDLMACERVIIAIASNGSLISPTQVDELKSDVLQRLGPISRAKAEGRFYQAVEAMD